MPIWNVYTLPLTAGKTTVLSRLGHESSSHAIAAETGQPMPLYTAIFVSMPVASPHVSSRAVPVNVEVHVYQTSDWIAVYVKKLQAASFWPCGPVVAAVLSNAKVPVPLIGIGVEQESSVGGNSWLIDS